MLESSVREPRSAAARYLHRSAMVLLLLPCLAGPAYAAASICETGAITTMRALGDDNAWGGHKNSFSVIINGKEYTYAGKWDAPATRSVYALAMNAFNTGAVIQIGGGEDACNRAEFTQVAM